MRRMSALSGAAVAVGIVAALSAAGVASADDLTSMTATASPTSGEPGDIIAVTVTVTNTFNRNLTYEPIAAPAPFEGCGVDIGTLKPDESVTVACQGPLPEPSDEEARFTFSIDGAPSEHWTTHAEAVLDIAYTPDVPSSPPPSTNPPVPPDRPTLPITGAPLGVLAAIGLGTTAVGGMTWAALRRRSHG